MVALVYMMDDETGGGSIDEPDWLDKVKQQQPGQEAPHTQQRLLQMTLADDGNG
jgi:hypothetical protein